MTRRISSLQWDDQTAYVFRGDEYVRLDSPDWAGSEVRDIKGNWTGLDVDSIDAGLCLPNGKAYLFCDDVYYRYDMAADRVDDGYPQPISSGWPGLPEQGISAAVVWPGGKAYFFASDQYYRYDIANDKVDDGYPQSIESGWSGLMTAVDAVIVLSPSEALFVNGSLYQLYDIASDKAIAEPAGLDEAFPPQWPHATSTGEASTQGSTSGTGTAGSGFSFALKGGESINDRVVRCCHEALDGGPMGEKDRHDDYRVFISCGQETSEAKAEALTHVRTSCAMFVRAVRHWCGTAPEGPYKPGTGMFTSMGGVSFAHPAYVKFTGSETPAPGDWFYVGDGKTVGHTGIFVEDLGDGRWKTAEGGGGDGTLCRFSERTFTAAGFAGESRTLQGWFDCTQVGLPPSP